MSGDSERITGKPEVVAGQKSAWGKWGATESPKGLSCDNHRTGSPVVSKSRL